MTESHHPPTPSSEEEREKQGKAPSSLEEGEKQGKAPSSLEEGVGSGGVTHQTMLKRAAEMRKHLTEPERRMWMELRDSRFCGHKFRRQVVMGWRIVDFFCPAKGLVVEVDGDTHDRGRDIVRDRQLAADTGFEVVRFSNQNVMRNFDGVLIALKSALDRQPERWSGRRAHHPPAPSSEEEGEYIARAQSSLEEGVGGGGGPQ